MKVRVIARTPSVRIDGVLMSYTFSKLVDLPFRPRQNDELILCIGKHTYCVKVNIRQWGEKEREIRAIGEFVMRFDDMDADQRKESLEYQRTVIIAGGWKFWYG